MKTLRKLMFTFVAVAGLSLAVSAQKDDKKDKPPKNPPTVDPADKNKPRGNPTPTPRETPKKPGMAFVLVIDRRQTDLA
jgi:cell division septation protein DedD